MTIKSAFFGALACLFCAGVALAPLAQDVAPAGGDAAMSGGVSFTSGQAASGKSTYDRSCAACHGGSLEGSNDAPGLSGDFFLGYWTGKSVGDLYAYMHDFMPPAAPSSLQPSQYADIAAYVLSRNGFEPGETPLSPEDDLDAMIIGQ